MTKDPNFDLLALSRFSSTHAQWRDRSFLFKVHLITKRQLPDKGFLAARIMKKHEWRENTPEGDVRLVCISRHGGKWRLRSRLKSDEEWTNCPDIPLDDLETLRELLWNKTQRNRLPIEQLSEVDALIAAAKLRR